ncbi:MAG: DNA/RNA non-specific endonuclease [Prevotellaceae bacterium]|nr:DNA/RNA non-specific endonuclease [Prevotellaceae bacterium]
MKKLNYLFYLLTFSLLFITSCSSDDDSDSSNSSTVNVNKNTVVAGGDSAIMRLEFPRVKGGNSVVIVHRTTGDSYDPDGINYCIEWDCDKKSQRWSCYQMHSGYTGSYSRVSSGYPNDPNLSSGDYYEEDYIYGSGYQHGHICPSADRKYSYTANEQTFYMTNMQPQYARFNGYEGSEQGLWLRLENKVRDLVPHTKTDTLYVCKGGTIDNEDQIISRIQGKLIVPKYFFMALMLKHSSGYRAVAFWMEQTNQWATDVDLADYAITIDELEEKTGIDFFCNLPDDIEERIESSYSENAWSL